MEMMALLMKLGAALHSFEGEEVTSGGSQEREAGKLSRGRLSR
jgi:hypothetical protein